MNKTSNILEVVSKTAKKFSFGITNNKNKVTLIILAFLLIYGFFLRIYFLGYQSFWIDESYSVTAAMGMIEHGKPLMPSGEVYRRAILNTSLISFSMKLFGISEFSARLPSVIFGVLTIFVVYLFFRKSFGEEVALVTSFLVTFSVVEIAWSRQARMYQQLQLFYLLSLYLFYEYLDTEKLKFGIFTFFSVIFSIWTHKLGLSLLLILPIYWSLKKLLEIKKISDFKKVFLDTRTLITIFVFLVGLIFSQIYFGAFSQVLSTNVNYLKEYLWYFRTSFPIVFYCSIIGIMISLRKDWEKSLLLVLAFLLPLYFVFFHEKLLGFRYVYFVLPIMFLFFARTVEYISGFFRKKTLRYVLLIVFLVSISFTPVINLRPRKNYYLEPRAPQPEFRSVYEYLTENREDEDVLIVSYPEVALWFEQEPDYWLAFSISGFRPSRWMDETENYYRRTVTPAIKNLDELNKTYQENDSGWLVLDSLSGHRIPPSYWNFISENLKWMEFPSKPGQAGAINLYHWDKGR